MKTEKMTVMITFPSKEMKNIQQNILVISKNPIETKIQP